MRFSAIFATLASAMLVSAIPAPAPAPEALAERNAELEARTPDDVSIILTTLNNNVKPYTDTLSGIDVVTIDTISGPCKGIEHEIKLAIDKVKLLKDVKTERGIFGSLGYIGVCNLLYQIIFLVLKVLAFLVGLLTEITRPGCLPLIQSIAFLLADLIALILSLLTGLLGLILGLVTQLLFGLLVGVVGYLHIIGAGGYWKSCGILIPGL